MTANNGNSEDSFAKNEDRMHGSDQEEHVYAVDIAGEELGEYLDKLVSQVDFVSECA